MLSSATTGRLASSAAATSSAMSTSTVRHHGPVSAPTQTLPDVDTRGEETDRTGDDTPKMFHYVRKNKIAESAVMGTHVVAL